MKRIVLVVILFITIKLNAQTVCTAPGQNPSTAFPVCGTSTFNQASVPLCGRRPIPSPCPNDGITDINPYWYKFTCFQSGTLGFTITPNNLADDYDWQLYDVTNTNPNDVYTRNLYIACNWSGESGITGASNQGNQLLVCGGLGKPLWSRMPDLIAGHDYLLLVSHFTNTQSGYSLSFGGGTAVITDSTAPKMNYADASCTGAVINVKLNKKMKCNSITSTGSEFSISPAGATIVSATGTGCNTGFDTDSLTLQLNQSLTPGNYTLQINNGSDGNTILDYCDKPIAAGETVNFIVLPQVPTPMDSMVPASCKMQQMKLIFSKPMLCNTIAADGSDFVVNGTYPVAVTSASGGACNGGKTKEITVTLDKPLLTQGNFIISLRNGSDGNTLLNECALQTPVGSSLSFAVKDTVNADFIYTIHYGCVTDTVNYFHPGGNGISKWSWNLDENKTSVQQNPVAFYNVFNTKDVQLAVSNGFCTDSSSASVALKNFLKADFFVHPNNCPVEPTFFTSKAEGMIARHQWEFGDGGRSDSASPSHIYAAPPTKTTFNIRYTVTDSIGCTQSITKQTTIYTSCLIAVPTAFTPNQDGKNDYFYPLNAVKAENLKFSVFNRYGQLIFHTTDWLRGWDGTLKGVMQQQGVYVWFLSYVDRDTRESKQQKGTVVLIR
jgi:gliding motility-associated-like protein